MKNASEAFLFRSCLSRSQELGGDIRYRQYTRHERPPTLLAIHGARSNLEIFDDLLTRLLLQAEIPSASFDLSGHGFDQPAEEEEYSLQRNSLEAHHFAELFRSSLNAVIGYSMGGALALKLAERHSDRINKIVLVCPAIYAESAYEVPFGEPFRSQISRPFSFLDCTSYKFLNEFSGQVLLIMGEHDGLQAVRYGASEGTSAGRVDWGNGRSVYSPIPAEVIQAIESAAKPKLRKIIVPDCDHSVLSALKATPDLAERITRQIGDFLNAE